MLRIGVDIGGTKIAAGIINEKNEIICKTWTPTRADEGAETVVAGAAGCIENALALTGFRLRECSGIGVGCPGVCDAESGIVTHAHNLGWEGVPLRAMLEDAAGIPVCIANDADCAALGEVAAGSAKGSEAALMVTLGTGIGGGLVINGRIFSGWRGLGGEIGHTCIAMGGEKCTCGERGCWEAYASASALIRQARRAAEENPASALNLAAGLDGRAVFDAYHAGDAAAAKVVERYLEYVGTGLVSAVNVLYPDVIILGGGISEQGEAMLAPVRRYVEKHIFAGGGEHMPRIVAAALGNDAGIIGASTLCGQT